MSGDVPLTNPWKPNASWVESAMREAEVGNLRLVYHSSNYVFIADLQHPEHGLGLGVYKPARGEQPLHDFPPRLYRREIAAYELDRLLGWEIVPPTVEATGEHGEGSLQLYIDHDPREHYFELREQDEFDWRFIQFAVFDLVANNADRKGGHVLLDPMGHLWGIDNGLCFHEVEKFRTVIWDFAGTEIPGPWRDDLDRVARCLASDDPIGEPLRGLLRPGEVAALVARLQHYRDHPVLPDVDDFARRVVPWPMV